MEVDVISLEAQDLSIQIGQFSANISRLEATTVTLVARSNATADLLQELERLVDMLEQTLANQIQGDVDEARRLLNELQNEVSCGLSYCIPMGHILNRAHYPNWHTDSAKL